MEVPGSPGLAARIEQHEASVWARCVELASNVPGDPLGARVDWGEDPPLAALGAIPSHALNRVVGLGATAPITASDLDRVVEWYRRHGQESFRLEIAPRACDAQFEDRLSVAGFRPIAESATKLWRWLDDPELEGDVEAAGPDAGSIQLLAADSADEVAALNVRAWGAWNTASSIAPWFSATIGREGFSHYGVFVNGQLVSTGAMALDGDLAWIGFDATHPRLQSRQLRRALTCRRLADARDAGCHVVHAEARSDALTSRSRLLRTLYVRRFFVHDADSAAAESYRTAATSTNDAAS